MRFGILGPLEIRDGDKVVDLGGPQLKSLLGTLLLEPNHVVSTDRLIETLWPGEPPATAPNALQVYVSRLRKALPDGDDIILTRRPGYMVRLGPGDLDAELFERLVADAAKARSLEAPAIASARLKQALDLWRGPALADLASDSASLRAAQLEEMRRVAIEDRIEAELGFGNHSGVIAELRSLVREFPLRERLWGQLMLALYRSGQQSAALAAYRDAHAVLAEELGVAPGPALVELERAILAHDPSLQGTSIELDADAEPHDADHDRRALVPLIGRRDHLLALNEATRLAERGRKVVVDVEGIAGSGKSRLLDEFLAALDGGRFDIRRTDSFRATRIAPGALLESLSLTMAARIDRDLSRVPVIVVDDAQWADPASLRRLDEVFGSEDDGLLLLLAHRPTRGAVELSLQSIQETGTYGGVLVRISLSKLSETEVAAVLEADRPEDIAKHMIDATGGLPFRMSELVSFWVDTGAMVRHDGRLAVFGELKDWGGPPYSAKNLAVLDDHERALVETVSVAGAPLPPQTAAHVLDLSDEEIANVAQSLQRAGILTRVKQGLAPVHDLAAEAVSTEIGDTRRAELLAGLAESCLALAQTEAERDRAGWYLLDAGDYQHAAPLLAAAADRCMASNDWITALPLIDGALLAYSHIAAPDETIAALKADRAKASLMQGHLHQAAHDLSAAMPHLSDAQRVDSALTLAWIAGDSGDVASGDVTLAMGVADAVRFGRWHTAGVMCTYHAVLLASCGFPEEAEAVRAKGVELLQRSGRSDDPNIPLGRAAIAFVRGDALRAESAYRECMRVVGDQDEWALLVVPWWVKTLHWGGRVTDALAEADALRRRASKSHSLIVETHLDEASSLGMSMIGRYDEALSLAERILETRTGVHGYDEPRARHAAALALMGLDRMTEAHDEIRNALDLLPGNQGWFERLNFRITELATASGIGGRWPVRVAEDLTEELLATRQLLGAAQLLASRAQAEQRRDLALFGAQIALDIGVPMVAARAAAVGELWDDPIGALVRHRLKEMETHMPPAWRTDWRELPHVAPFVEPPHL